MAALRLEATKWRCTFGYYALFVCLGLSTAIIGPTIPDLARETGSSLGSMGMLFLGGSIGYTLGTILGGRLFDRLRGHTLLAAAELAVASCLAVFPTVRWLWLLLALAFCRGLAEGLVNTGANTLLLWTHGEKASPFMNGLHFCFGVGAFVAPLVVARFTSSPSGFRWAYWGVAGFAALSGLWVLTTSGSPDPAEHAGKATQARNGGRVHYAPITAAALFLFAYVGAELSFGSWVFTYAVTLGVASAAGAAVLTSAFWLSFTVGRLVSIPAAIRFTPRQVIPAAIAACLVFSGLLAVLPQSSGLLWASAVGLGFSMAPLWPSGYTLAGQVIPMTAFASSLVLLGDSFGGMVLPALTGTVMQASGDRLSLSLPLLVFGSLAVCLLAYLALAARGRSMARAAAAGASGEE
jgi:MFS transporter, FHS family, Na+ dependent glucose transporter 1